MVNETSHSLVIIATSEVVRCNSIRVNIGRGIGVKIELILRRNSLICPFVPITNIKFSIVTNMCNVEFKGHTKDNWARKCK